jgi:hypothetical protein
MSRFSLQLALILLLAAAAARPAAAADDARGEDKPSQKAGPGAIVTLWPLFDYRSSPATGYSNLSLLGPLFKRERTGSTTITALRPLFFSSSTPEDQETEILYPIASTSASGGDNDTQVLKLYQKHVSRSGTPEEKRDSMLFPLYISGQSEKYGPYTSVFPLYGDIYERFWRDEYHYFLFPLYGRTVKKDTSSTNYLYPFFNTVSGERESGFQFWPLYGQASKAGVYDKRFVLWPFFISEHLAQDSDNPVTNLSLLPLFASSQSPQRSAVYAPWPFCGVVRDTSGQVIERDFLWPFWLTAKGKESYTDRYIPFYSSSRSKDVSSTWVMWPLYRHETIASATFKQDKTSLLYFLFSRSDEFWPQLGRDRARGAFWPLYAWKRDEDGIRTLTMPALVEPIIWNDGVERNWAPLWRLFIFTWDDKGNGATSLLWNLYWREKRGEESAGELSPLFSWRSAGGDSEFRILKGLFGYGKDKDRTTLRILWIPFGI